MQLNKGFLHKRRLFDLLTDGLFVQILAACVQQMHFAALFEITEVCQIALRLPPFLVRVQIALRHFLIDVTLIDTRPQSRFIVRRFQGHDSKRQGESRLDVARIRRK